MSVVEVIRHSYKAPDGSLSPEGITKARYKGSEYAGKYPGRPVKAVTSTIPRAQHTGELVMEGAGQPYDGSYTITDDRLTHHLDNFIPAIRASKEETSLEAALEACELTVLWDAVGIAQVVDENITTNDNTVYVAVTHSPTVQALAYLLTGKDLNSTKKEAEPLTGLTFDGDTVTLNYADGREITIDNATEACAAAMIDYMEEFRASMHDSEDAEEGEDEEEDGEEGGKE